MLDYSGNIGTVLLCTIIGVAISAVIGAVCAGISTASSGGSTQDVIVNSIIGGLTAGGIATVAAFGALGTITMGAVALASAGIGALGEVASISYEYFVHKDEPEYNFDLEDAFGRVVYSAFMGVASGTLSSGIGIELINHPVAGVLVSFEGAFVLGVLDFALRKLFFTEKPRSARYALKGAFSHASTG